MISSQNPALRVESNPPALRREKGIIPILLRAAFDLICGRSFRAINGNHRIGVFGGRTHNLTHSLAIISGMNLIETAVPTIKLPKKKTCNSKTGCGRNCTDKTHPSPLSQGSHGKTSRQKNCQYENADKIHENKTSRDTQVTIVKLPLLISWLLK